MHTTRPTTASITASTPAPRRPWAAALLCACMAWGLVAAPDSAHAARKKTSTGNATSTPAANKGSIKIKHYPSPSQETTAERDRRMYRECWGRPNAGACLGYTRR